ncbi:MAG: hypothetical protein H6728_16975 [Myxococcales bacterium]|nr:hypothetical protein [Myxococcales bacterium]
MRSWFVKFCAGLLGKYDSPAGFREQLEAEFAKEVEAQFLSSQQQHAYLAAHKAFSMLLAESLITFPVILQNDGWGTTQTKPSPQSLEAYQMLVFSVLGSAFFPMEELKKVQEIADWLAKESAKSPSSMIDSYGLRFGQGEDVDALLPGEREQRFVAARDLLLADLMPVRGGNRELVWVPIDPAAEEAANVFWGGYDDSFRDRPKVVIRIFQWESRENGMREIRDIIEQEMFTPPFETTSFERFRRMMEGWALALREFFVWEAQHPRDFMPFDLFSDAILNAYHLKKAQTQRDFYQAMKAQRRLGKFGTWKD